jgi:putative membrane protein insertion efficiency factor
VTVLATLLVRGYRTVLTPLFPPRCKYHPTCSQYALDALREFGFLRGIALAGWRLLRCNPLSDGGVDHARDQRIFRKRKQSAPDPLTPGAGP